MREVQMTAALMDFVLQAGDKMLIRGASFHLSNRSASPKMEGPYGAAPGETLQGTRTVIPPLHTDHLHRPGNLRPYNLSKELFHSHAARLCTLRCELKQNPAILFPSTLVLKGRSPFSMQSCKFSRPKVDYPVFNLLPFGDKMKDQSYPDPIIGASRSFIHRISELLSLEGDTVRQEKLKKTRKHKKHPS
ncbi:uncharacterized protein si:ch211-171b20.3 isoform X2 [Thalassophryne amazonica]|uniref:uncharacterized protein si:ch211-171b20.3 isoform X2 n=1 Tax=Thalassophryne amazonica TaxID=390379 RepID=UPI001470D038|nr:uncharacterized protein si:ch211-171b20.3 isoform X2 [Thalassophryne amazonica]